MRLYERLNFAGVRVVAVSQGIDTSAEQADVLMTMHGLVDALYVKELAKKTHRGLEGQILRGFHAGGRCFGYRNIETQDGVRLEIKEDEARVVRRIFALSADGLSLRSIAKTLNGENVPPPRPRSGKKYATWCPSGIREMLRRELYIGKITWNQSHFVKRPGTNKRVRRERPRSDWRIVDRPELRIVPEELWARVQGRLAWVTRTFGNEGRRGLLNRSATSPYLLTGFLKCGVCGANLAIVTGRGPGRKPKYGCPQNFYRGACLNNLKERQDRLESRMLSGLQNEVLKPEVIEFVIEEFGRQFHSRLTSFSDEFDRLRKRKDELGRELRRLTDAVAQQGASNFLMQAINERERELREITDRLPLDGPGPFDLEWQEVRRFITERVDDIRSILAKDVLRAREELAKHVGEIRMQPREVGVDRFYVAEGEWNLLGRRPETGRTRQLSDWRVRMVAGACYAAFHHALSAHLVRRWLLPRNGRRPNPK
jgi:hypothetical protein